MFRVDNAEPLKLSLWRLEALAHCYGEAAPKMRSSIEHQLGTVGALKSKIRKLFEAFLEIRKSAPVELERLIKAKLREHESSI
jgi:hypothetical protein